MFDVSLILRISVNFLNNLVKASVLICLHFNFYGGLQSTGSLFHDKSITLGNLIWIKNILELSRRSERGRKTDKVCKYRKSNNTTKFKLCFFSLCSKDSTDGEYVNKNNHPPSLGHFLAVERRVAIENYRETPPIYGPDEEVALADH